VKTGPLFLNLTLDGGNGAASPFDRFTPVVKLRFLFRPKFGIILTHVDLVFRFTCSSILILTPLTIFKAS